MIYWSAAVSDSNPAVFTPIPVQLLRLEAGRIRLIPPRLLSGASPRPVFPWVPRLPLHVPSRVLINTSRIAKGTDLVPLGLRVLATTKVAQCPSSITQHRDLVVFVEQDQQGLESAGSENVVSAFGRVAGNVAQSPNTACQLPSAGDRRSGICSSRGRKLRSPNRPRFASCSWTLRGRSRRTNATLLFTCTTAAPFHTPIHATPCASDSLFISRYKARRSRRTLVP